MRICLIFWFVLFALPSWAQPDTTRVFRIDSLPGWNIWLDKGWKFHAGDNSSFAQPAFDDSRWEHINPTQDINELPSVRTDGQGWLRLRLAIHD
ncbi:MAG TPA: hypothetical protein VK364_07235, partial [Hymenobacter sp.]|nr:hypothetical protein [Hymenobacter sp.]